MQIIEYNFVSSKAKFAGTMRIEFMRTRSDILRIKLATKSLDTF